MRNNICIIAQQFLHFGAVGSIGFAIDGGLLYALITNGIDPYLARLFSFPLAVLATWWLNRIWTFSNAQRARPVAQLGKYLAVQITGALCNYVTYAFFLGITEPTQGNAMIGFVIGSALGLVVNFFGARVFAFTRGLQID